MTVRIELLSEHNDPYVGSFSLELPTGGVLSNQSTDKRGSWARDNLPAGKYTVTVAGQSITLVR